eukprot:m.478792 g.478792  ORF g.478792 m.478792 type:complete len:175 (-) comp21232_c0_seq1:318-842(-)
MTAVDMTGELCSGLDELFGLRLFDPVRKLGRPFTDFKQQLLAGRLDRAAVHLGKLVREANKQAIKQTIQIMCVAINTIISIIMALYKGVANVAKSFGFFLADVKHYWKDGRSHATAIAQTITSAATHIAGSLWGLIQGVAWAAWEGIRDMAEAFSQLSLPEGLARPLAQLVQAL